MSDNIRSGRDNGMFTNDTGYDSKISGISHAVSICHVYADSDSCSVHVLQFVFFDRSNTTGFTIAYDKCGSRLLQSLVVFVFCDGRFVSAVAGRSLSAGCEK